MEMCRAAQRIHTQDTRRVNPWSVQRKMEIWTSTICKTNHFMLIFGPTNKEIHSSCAMLNNVRNGHCIFAYLDFIVTFLMLSIICATNWPQYTDVFVHTSAQFIDNTYFNLALCYWKENCYWGSCMYRHITCKSYVCVISC